MTGTHANIDHVDQGVARLLEEHERMGSKHDYLACHDWDRRSTQDHSGSSCRACSNWKFRPTLLYDVSYPWWLVHWDEWQLDHAHVLQHPRRNPRQEVKLVDSSGSNFGLPFWERDFGSNFGLPFWYYYIADPKTLITRQHHKGAPCMLEDGVRKSDQVRLRNKHLNVLTDRTLLLKSVPNGSMSVSGLKKADFTQLRCFVHFPPL